jgi:hypothetical protein
VNVDRLLTSVATVDFVAPTGAADAFGDPTEVVTTVTFKAWLSQTQRSDDTVNANTQIGKFAIYLDSSAAAVQGFDRVTVDGVVYELDGPPWPALNPRTRQITHVECTGSVVR